MHCSSCGTALQADAAFCSKCGRPLGVAGAPSPAMALAQIQPHAIAAPDPRWTAYLAQCIEAGGKLESQVGQTAVVVYGEKVNHLLHFMIGAMTCGLWWIAWFFLAVFDGQKRWAITMAQDGRVSMRRT